MNGFLVVVRSIDDIPVRFCDSMAQANEVARRLVRDDALTDAGRRIVEKVIVRLGQGSSEWMLHDRLDDVVVCVVEFRNGFVAKRWHFYNGLLGRSRPVINDC